MANLTPEACRAARGILGWSARELAAAADVSLETINRFENGREMREANRAKIGFALESAGVEILNGDAPGARRRELKLAPDLDVTLWPTRENYERFRAVCDDNVPATFDEFEALAGRRLAVLASQGIHIERLEFDPDDLARWCKAKSLPVNAAARKLYVAMLALS